MTSLDQIVLSEDFILKGQPKKDVDLRNETREPSVYPRGFLP